MLGRTIRKPKPSKAEVIESVESGGNFVIRSCCWGCPVPVYFALALAGIVLLFLAIAAALWGTRFRWVRALGGLGLVAGAFLQLYVSFVLLANGVKLSDDFSAPPVPGLGASFCIAWLVVSFGVVRVVTRFVRRAAKPRPLTGSGPSQ